MKSVLRRSLACIILLLSVFGVSLAHAANCTGSGTLVISLSPCPLAAPVKHGVATALTVGATVKGTVSGTVFVFVVDPAGVIESNASVVRTSTNQYRASLHAKPTLTLGHHTGSLTIKVCGDSKCHTLYVQATLPYNLDVLAPPHISSISPTTVTVGAAPFTLTVTGSNFVSGCGLLFEGDEDTFFTATKFVSSTEFKATVNLSGDKSGEQYSVSLIECPALGDSTNGATLTLKNPVPVLTKVSPNFQVVGATIFNITVAGSKFVPGSKIHFFNSHEDSLLDTKFISATALKAQMDLEGVASGQAYSVTVEAPAPGGGASQPLSFTLNNAAPTLTSVSPTNVVTGGGSATLPEWFFLTIDGTGFQPNSTVVLSGITYQSISLNSVTSTEIVAQVNMQGTQANGTVNVQVVNPAPGGGGSSTQPITVDIVPIPQITGLSPASAAIGSAAFTLTITGTGFEPNTSVQLTSTGNVTQTLSSTYVSSTELQAQVPSNVLLSIQNLIIQLNTPSPGGSSANATLSVVNATPVVTSLSPSSATAGAGAFTLTVNGSGFQSNSHINLSGTALTTTVKSSTQLTAQIPAASIATAANLSVTVSTPTPGGGVSNAVSLAVSNGAPSISWVTPLRVYVGSGDKVLTIGGTNFVAATGVKWDGAALQTTHVSNTLLQAILPAADMTDVTTATLSVTNPVPGGGEADASYAVVAPPPAIASLSPGYAVTGADDFTLTVEGADFDPDAVVEWGGSDLVTTFVSSTELQAAVPAADVAASGVTAVTVVNPDDAGGSSIPATFAVDPSGTSVQTLSQVSNDIAWDQANFLLYASVPSTDAIYPESILSIDPKTVSIGGTATAAAEPKLLAASADGEFLYASLEANHVVQRYTLPDFGVDASMPLGSVSFPAHAIDMRVSPVYPHLLALIAGDNGVSPSNEGPLMYVDGSLAPAQAPGASAWDALAWNPDGTMLYGANEEISFGTVYTVGFTLSSASTVHNFLNLWPEFYKSSMVYDPDGLLYSSFGEPIDPVAGKNAGNFGVTGPMAPDSSLGCAYFITQTQAQIDAAAGDWTLSCYDVAAYTLTRSMIIPGMSGTPKKVLRWGNEGLVIQTTTAIYFVSGQFVTGN